MRHWDFTKNVVMLVIGISAFILLIAEGDTLFHTFLAKVIACALISCDIMIYRSFDNNDNSYDAVQ
jgi:hypothetical protein